MSTKALFTFAEPATTAPNPSSHWKVLSVEDDPNYQNSLVYCLKSVQVLERPLQILTASSGAGAAEILARNPDICLILLDVVMEDDDAGLLLVNTIREVIGNTAVRIVLLTGQPGMAPRQDIMLQYDIDEYWNKSDLTNDILIGVISTHIRTWNYLNELKQAREGLQLIIDAARNLNHRRDLPSFTQTVLAEISNIIGIKSGGVICFGSNAEQLLTGAKVLSASGDYTDMLDQTISATEFSQIAPIYTEAVRQQQHIFRDNYTVLFFNTADIDSYHYLVVVKTTTPLQQAHIHLLQVFSENIKTGFTNVALLNRLSELAYFDPVLKLPNRNWMIRELQTLTSEQRQRSRLLLLDVNHFTDMNISFGQAYCEQLLRQLSSHIHGQLPAAYALAKVGTDAFAILMDAEETARFPFETLTEQTIVANGIRQHLRLSVLNIPLVCVQGSDPEHILPLAESALDMARRSGHHYSIYTQEVTNAAQRRYQRLQALHEAIIEHQLFLVLQPKFHLQTSLVVGFEALVRWRTESGEIIPPDEFIPLAETSGLITQLDLEVFRMTLSALHDLRATGHELPIAFNASCADLTNPDYIDTLISLLQASALPTTLVELEITESQAMQDYIALQPILQRLLDVGIRINIDDFGTGYSSLAHITNLKASALKIDRSFVQPLGQNRGTEVIAEMILRIGKRFGYTVIAEGIETAEQQAWLLKSGCEIGQGYYLARPMPMEQLQAWLLERVTPGA